MKYTENEIADTLAEYSPWVRYKAKQFPSFPADDLAQEALLAMWKELIKYEIGSKIPIDYIMKRRATWRMLDIVSGRPWTSYKDYKRHTGLIHNPVVMSPLRSENASSGENDRDTQLERATLESARCVYDEVEYTLYYDDIVDALKEHLTPRQQEYLLVLAYGGSTREHFGYDAHTMITKKHKEKLQRSLAHLEEMVH